MLRSGRDVLVFECCEERIQPLVGHVHAKESRGAARLLNCGQRDEVAGPRKCVRGFARARQQARAESCQADSLRRAIEQLDAELMFEVVQGFGDRRLRTVQCLGRTGYAERIRDCKKDTGLSDSDRMHE